MNKNIHANHRDRVRKEFLENGFTEATPPHKILEMLLFYSIPRKDTNVLAHVLLEKFGSIKAVLDAPVSELLKVDGVGENTAALLKLIMPLARNYISEKSCEIKSVNDLDEVGEYLIGKHLGYSKEVLGITSFDAKGNAVAFDIVNEGDTTAVEVSFKKIIEIIMKRNPAGVVLSHNHPNGYALPSEEDIKFTIKIKNILSDINIELIDHMIVVADDFVSLKQSDVYKKIFKS